MGQTGLLRQGVQIWDRLSFCARACKNMGQTGRYIPGVQKRGLLQNRLNKKMR